MLIDCIVLRVGGLNDKLFLSLSRPWKGDPIIPYPLKYFEKYPISLKEIWQITRNSEIIISIKVSSVLRGGRCLFKREGSFCLLKVMESIPKITEVFKNFLNAIGDYCQEGAEPYHKQVDRTNYICSVSFGQT